MHLIRTRFGFFTIGVVMLVSMLSLSCDREPIGPEGPDPLPPPPPGTYMPFSDFRALYTGSGDVTVPAGTRKVRGVVISNHTNEAAGNYRLQDESGSGLYFYSVVGSPIYGLGSVLEIDAAGVGVLTLYNGDIELKSVPQDRVVPVAGTIPIAPRQATIAEIIANRDSWSSTLVKVTGLSSIAQSSTNSTGTTYTLTDATGSMTMFVRHVSGITVDTTATSVTGYVSIFNANTQIGIRTAADLQ